MNVDGDGHFPTPHLKSKRSICLGQPKSDKELATVKQPKIGMSRVLRAYADTTYWMRTRAAPLGSVVLNATADAAIGVSKLAIKVARLGTVAVVKPDRPVNVALTKDEIILKRLWADPCLHQGCRIPVAEVVIRGMDRCRARTDRSGLQIRRRGIKSCGKTVDTRPDGSIIGLLSSLESLYAASTRAAE